MDIIEFGAIVIVAHFTITGGAFINGALTAPERCLRVLDWKWPYALRRLLPSGLIFTVAGLLIRKYSEDNSEIGGGIAVIGFCYLAHVYVLGQARRIAQKALL